MKVKELMEILSSEEEITVYFQKGDNTIELELIDGKYFDNLDNKYYYVNEDCESIENDNSDETLLKADLILDFNQFNDCEVVQFTVGFCPELTIKQV